MGKINCTKWSLVLLNIVVIIVKGEGIGEERDRKAVKECVFNGTIYTNMCKCTLSDTRSFDGTDEVGWNQNCRKCSLQHSKCSTHQQCCSISNGKSYCNVKIGRCAAIRYCAESSTFKCPFDDLSSEEIADTITIIKQSNSFSSQIIFPIVRQQEPKKKEWNSGERAAKQRIAYAAVLDVRRDVLSEVLISLNSHRIISKKDRPQSVALVTNYEYDTAKEMLRNDDRVIRAYERRGLNMSYASFDLWAYGSSGNVRGRRLLKTVFDYKDPGTRYMDWRPVEVLEATINLSEGTIIDFIDDEQVILPVPKSLHLSESVKSTPRPLKNTTPQGTSIKLNGYVVSWHKWRFQYSMDPVHGLQMYHIRYLADCEERFLIYKLSISEMYVPYGAQGKTWRWRGAFDAGEYGLGRSIAPIVLGQDVPQNAMLLSCPQIDDKTGKVSELEGCIALYERAAGSMYKHFDVFSDNQDGKTSGEIVAAFMCAVGNYDYVFEYVFKEDGNIDVGIYATGILLSKATVQVKNDPNCIEDCQDFINENTIAPTHQHFFNYRIDFDIEGANNVVTEDDFVRDPRGPENLDGGAFSLRRTIIPHETFRDYSAKNARFWTVINPQSRNKFNTPRGYSIQPSNVAFSFLQEGNPLNQALFITHPLWVTSYNDDEQGAAGVFPRSGESGQGLPRYIRNRQSLDNDDLVVWHTLGLTHAPRPEEYPLMNSMRVGFQIVSRNFQSSNQMVSLKNQCNRQISSLKFM